MKRQYAKPLLEPDVLCLYRRPGSVVAQLVRAGRWEGAAVGYAPDTDSQLLYHRFMRTQPHVGPLAGVNEQHLVELPEDASAYEIAAVFVEQLAGDAKIADDGARLLERIPTLAGPVRVEVMVPPGPNWRWVVQINGKQVASTEADWHVDALKDLANHLRDKAEGLAMNEPNGRIDLSSLTVE